MKDFRVFLVIIILVPFIVVNGQSSYIESNIATSEYVLENCGFHGQLNSSSVLKEIEHLSSFSGNEELPYQYFSSFNSQQTVIINNNNTVFLFMQKHLQSLILFESDTSPPIIKQS